MAPTKNKLIIASSEASADLSWATRFFVPDPVSAPLKRPDEATKSRKTW